MLYFTRWKTTLIWLTVFAAVAFAFPNLLSKSTLEQFPDFLPSEQMTLGLDLQGGSHILLQVERGDIVEERLESMADEVRRILREAGIGYTGLSGNGQVVRVRIRDEARVEEAKDLLGELTQPINTGMFSGGTIAEATLEEHEPGHLQITLTDQGIDYRVSAAVSKSIEVVRRRVDELGTTEPSIQRQGTDRILVQVPGLDDPERLKDLLNQTAKLSFRMVDVSMPVSEALQGRPPASSEILYSTDEPPVPYLVKKAVDVSGENLVDAQAGFDQRTNEPIVTFKFDSRGGQRFGQITQQNIGLPFAIVLDEQVISAPVIQSAILGGTGQISGNFTAETANDLAILLRAGALPATLTPIEERTVGPGLGADSISAGKIASAIAAILVVAFMFLAYGFLGFIANLALMANVVMIIAVLTILGATLTLPGIAGIVLTMGMAVDSNVIIFERVREERREGRSLIKSLDAGFQRALATVVDANMTTFIAAVILFYVGTGPVRGFAVTLGIGIITTVFTAYTLTRWMIAWWLRRYRPTEMPAGLVNYLPAKPNVGFMGMRRFAFVLSTVASLAAMVSFGTVNMNYGIDFLGGSSIQVEAKDGTADVGAVRTALEAQDLGEVQVQEFGNQAELLIRLGTQDGSEAAEQAAIAGVRTALAADYDFRRVEVVGPTVSSELAQAGVIAVIASMLAMLVYIWIRFEWQFGVGAILTTLHDVIMMVGFFVWFQLEFNLTSIAAILTVVGYSINDTVVVYDRVRENLRKFKRMPIEQLLNLSMNETLSRTILTGVTTLMALAALYLLGGEVISSFTIAMIFGILIGTYSSIFVAGPLLILFKLRSGAFDTDKAEQQEGTTGGKTAV